MQPVFVDTSAWIAMINPREALHEVMRHAGLHSRPDLITSELVLVETLNYFSERGPFLRGLAERAVRGVVEGNLCVVVDFRGTPFGAAFDLFRARRDKAWSLTDCSSIELMRAREIRTVYTFDRHFMQAGFQVLPELPEC